jgi:hypothetical protein
MTSAAGAIASAPFLKGLSVFSVQSLAAALKVDYDELAASSRHLDTFISQAAAGPLESVDELQDRLDNLRDATDIRGRIDVAAQLDPGSAPPAQDLPDFEAFNVAAPAPIILPPVLEDIREQRRRGGADAGPGKLVMG